MVEYTKEGPPKHRLDRPEIRSYLWEHGLLQAVLKSIAAQRNSYSHHVRGVLFGHFLPANGDYTSNLEMAGRILRGAVNGRGDENGWSTLMPCLAACSIFRSGKGSANMFVSSGSSEFTNSSKRKLDGKTIQHLIRHPAHEALTRLLIIKAVIQIDDTNTRRTKGSTNNKSSGKSPNAKEKVSPFSRNEEAMSEIIRTQGESLTMPTNLSRCPGYSAGDIEYFKILVSAINNQERPQMRSQKPIPKRFFFDFQEHPTSPPRKRTHDDMNGDDTQPSQLLIPIISLDDVEDCTLHPDGSGNSVPFASI